MARARKSSSREKTGGTAIKTKKLAGRAESGSLATTPSRATTRLFRAVEKNDLVKAAEAIAQGADPNQQVKVLGHAFRGTMMPAICACGSLAMLNLVLSAGGDVNQVDDEGTPLGHRLLIYAQLKSQGDLGPMFKAMAEAGYNLHATTPERGEQAIHWILNSSQAGLVPVWCELGGDVNAADLTGETVLHRLAYFGNSDLAIRMVQHGADPTIRERNGWTVFDYARNESDREPQEIEAFCLAVDAAWQAQLMNQRTTEPSEIEGEPCPRCGKIGPHLCRF